MAPTTRKRRATQAQETGDTALEPGETKPEEIQDASEAGSGKPAAKKSAAKKPAAKKASAAKKRKVGGEEEDPAGEGAGAEQNDENGAEPTQAVPDSTLPVIDDTDVNGEQTETKDRGGGGKPNSGDDNRVDDSKPEDTRAQETTANANTRALNDLDDDPLVRIENELNTARYEGLDAGTKKRLAVILEFIKMRPDVLDDKVLEQLRGLPKTTATEIMKQLDHSVRTSKVRKISAYLSSMIRRAQDDKQDRNQGSATVEDLAPVSRAILAEMIGGSQGRAGILREGDLDGKVLGLLASKSPEHQAYILKAFARKNLGDVRNMAAFFVAHMRDIERGLDSGRYSLDRVPGGERDGGRDPRQARRDEVKQREHRNPHPDIYDPHYEYVPLAQRGAGGMPPAGVPPPSMPPAPQHYPQQNRGYEQYDPYAPPAMPAVPQREPKHFALEQVQWGVRVDELNGLSDWAKFVHPAAALRLQQLWDVDENKLVSVLDDNSWLLLAGLDAPNSVKAVNETAERMKLSSDDVPTINRLFVEMASKYPRREDAPPMPSSATTVAMQQFSAPLAASALSSLPPQATTYGNPLFERQGAVAGAPPSQYLPPPTHQPPAYNPQYAPHSHLPQINLPGPAGSLSPRLQTKIDSILGNPTWIGRILIDHFNDHVVNLMLQLDERSNLAVLDEFERTESNKIRNPKAYLIGKIRQALERRDGAPGHRGDGRGRGGGGARHGHQGPRF